MNKTNKIRSMVMTALFAALLVVLSFISIPLPFSTVPITGQTLGIMLIGSILGPIEAAGAVIVYLLLGAVGLPVFAGGHSGLGVLFGPTGGFLFSFIFAAIVISLLKGDGKKALRLALANTIGGIIVVYLIGVPWLSFMIKVSLTKALAIGALPYLPLDIIKVVFAVIIAVAVNRRLGFYLHNKEDI